MILRLNDSLIYFKRVLLRATDRVWHYRKPRNEQFPYLIWAETSEDTSMHANNKKDMQSIQIAVDYYTQQEFDPVIDGIQTALNDAENISFELVDVLYEEELNVIHYSWDARVNYGKNDHDGI